MKKTYNHAELYTLFQNRDFETIIKQAGLFKKANKSNPDALTILGVVFAQTGSTKTALQIFQQVLKLDASNPKFWNNVANAQRTLTFFHEAIKSYESAIAINPDYTEALNGYAGSLMDIGQVPKAIEIYNKAITHEPNNLEIKFNLALAHIANGDFGEAKDLLNQIITSDPKHADAYHQLSRIHRFKKDDTDIEKMKAVVTDVQATVRQKVLINHALGKAQSDLKEYRLAFAHWELANQTFKQSIRYQFDEDQAIFDRIHQWHHSPFETKLNPISGKKPIFVLGMPRSGTSLVEQILSGHSEIFAAGELETLGFAMRDYEQTHDRLNKSALNAIRQDYLNNLNKLDTDCQIITDKMPLNFKWIGIIRSIFPQAPILHLKRHPMAICFSNFRNFFRSHGMRYSNDLLDIGRYYLGYDALMQHFYEKFGDSIYTVDYEALTENPKQQIENMLNHLDLDWQESCLKIEENKRSVKTVSNTQIRSGIYKKSSEEWELYEEDLAPLFEMLKPILKRDGWI